MSDNNTWGYKSTRLVAQSPNQKLFIKAIRDNDVVLCHGPPGSGKTHIAAAAAVKMMKDEQVERIVLCRPVVSVGKDIGYLPGDMENKIGPYLRPLFDEIHTFVEVKMVRQWMGEDKLEICPLSMMRGRTFKDSFVILDEAQNASYEELKMLLTRFGFNSKTIVVGDVGQSDLPYRERGSFQEVIGKIGDLDGVQVVGLNRSDIVRHELTGQIEERLSGAN